ncbi:type II toxin-antitoxin system VapC family toxin [Pelobium manganitolerans]|uniref:type II toxin-antitoxin system VapC family toxin n=1 Tax=Pelobium manganitolerans TaxID=1842495 RepID=UPI003FA365C5
MKNYLLDTHTLLWFLNGDIQLSMLAKENIESSRSTKYISIISLWEIAIKLNLNKMSMQVSLTDLKNEIINNGFKLLPIEFNHLTTLLALENHHKDPFDRLIIAQAITEELTLISKDQNFVL